MGWEVEWRVNKHCFIKATCMACKKQQPCSVLPQETSKRECHKKVHLKDELILWEQHAF